MFTSLYLSLLFAVIDISAEHMTFMTKLGIICIGGAIALLVIALGLVITALIIRYQDERDK